MSIPRYLKLDEQVESFGYALPGPEKQDNPE
jgi:hypothetical protein